MPFSLSGSWVAGSFGAKETSGKACLVLWSSTGPKARQAGASAWGTFCSWQRGRGCCLVCHIGNLGLRTDALSRNRAFALYAFIEHLLSLCL